MTHKIVTISKQTRRKLFFIWLGLDNGHVYKSRFVKQSIFRKPKSILKVVNNHRITFVKVDHYLYRGIPFYRLDVHGDNLNFKTRLAEVITDVALYIDSIRDEYYVDLIITLLNYFPETAFVIGVVHK